MNIFVCLKQVPDTEASISVKDGNTINETSIKWIISPYDEYAIEEALKLKEKNPGSTVTALSLGPTRVDAVLRTALAMGVEKAIHIETKGYLDYKNVARALAEVIRKETIVDIIFMGKQAIDDDAYQIHGLLSVLLDIPVATNVTAFSFTSNAVLVEREIDEGAREKIEMKLPCIVGAAKGLNSPRYASVMGIMKAKKMEVKKIQIDELGINESQNKVILIKLNAPAEKPQGRIIPGEPAAAVKELVGLLRNDAKVI